MLVTTDNGIKEDTVVYGVGGNDIFLPLSTFSYVLSLHIDCSDKNKPIIYSKDNLVFIELNVNSSIANVNGNEIILPNEVYEHNGIVLVPIKCLCSKLGYNVKDTYNCITITKN